MCPPDPDPGDKHGFWQGKGHVRLGSCSMDRLVFPLCLMYPRFQTKRHLPKRRIIFQVTKRPNFRPAQGGQPIQQLITIAGVTDRHLMPRNERKRRHPMLDILLKGYYSFVGLSAKLKVQCNVQWNHNSYGKKETYLHEITKSLWLVNYPNEVNPWQY